MAELANKGTFRLERMSSQSTRPRLSESVAFSEGSDDTVSSISFTA